MSRMLRLGIERLAYGGDAIAHAEDGRTVFVRGGCPGDLVDAEVYEEHERYLKAITTQVVEPSPDRVKPPCPYFGECGGCQWQHVAYRRQTEAKRQEVQDAFARIARIEVDVAETVIGDAPYGYRNRIELGAEQVGGRLALGYRALAEERLVPVETCELPPSRFRSAPKALTGALRYLSRSDDLRLHRVSLRVGRAGDVEVDLWTSPGPFPRRIAAKTIADAVGAKTITRAMVKDPKRRDKAQVEVLGGRGAWRERLGEYHYFVSAPSFFQVNTAVAVKLQAAVVEALSPDGSDRVLDLYSGVGTFTLPLAELAGQVVAVEGSGPAIRDLRRNLEANELFAEIEPGDAARVLPDLGRFDSAVVDPPRAGLAPVALEALIASRPQKIAYVSCDPATLSRDAALLVAQGYSLRSVTPFDLFAQSYHVETLAVFRRD